MKKIFLLPIALLLLTLTACEDVVQIDLDKGSKMYVIDAFITDKGGTQIIRVLENDSYFSTTEAPPVSYAQVKVTDLTINKTYSFTYAGNGNYAYTGTDTLGGNEHLFKLTVTIDGVDYTSEETQHRKAFIDTIIPVDFEALGFGPDAPKGIQAIVARDLMGPTTDYYNIVTYKNDTLMNPKSPNLVVDGTGGAIPDDGTPFRYFDPPGIYQNFVQFKKGDICRAEIHSISHDNFYWYIQAQNQINNAGLFATTPENVKTNIITPADAKHKATGRFSVAGVVSKEIVAQ